jgi:hypothetical protein
LNQDDLLLPMARNQCSNWRKAIRDTAGHATWALRAHASAWPGPSHPYHCGGHEPGIHQHDCPARLFRNTNIKAWHYWWSVLTWAAGRSSFHCILPMDQDTLSAMLWDFAAMGASPSTLKAIHHRDSGLPSPVSGHMFYTRLTRCLGRLLCTQHPHKLAVTRDMVVALLCYSPRNLVELYLIHFFLEIVSIFLEIQSKVFSYPKL